MLRTLASAIQLGEDLGDIGDTALNLEANGLQTYNTRRARNDIMGVKSSGPVLFCYRPSKGGGISRNCFNLGRFSI